MAAATSQIFSLQQWKSAYLSLPIAASTKIPGGVAVCTNASGYLVNAADTSGLIFAGFADQSINPYDNTSGSNGAFNVPVTSLENEDGLWVLNATSPAQSWVGTHMFWLDNQTVGQAGSSTNKVIAGTCLAVFTTGTAGQVLVSVKNRYALAAS